MQIQSSQERNAAQDENFHLTMMQAEAPLLLMDMHAQETDRVSPRMHHQRIT
jgi:hypothetical protein